jgi:hypothetical protein
VELNVSTLKTRAISRLHALEREVFALEERLSPK